MVLALLPSRALFRVDQVMAARGLMAGLFGLQILLAGARSWSGSRRAWCWWWLAAAALLAITALFFPLTSWGTSDVTKLSVWFAVAPGRGTVGELSWHLVGPLISLHFRMAVGAWSGGGRLGVNGVFTGVPLAAAGLAVLLLLLLMLLAARLVRLPWGLVGGAIVWSPLTCTDSPVNLLFALLPALFSRDGRGRAAGATPTLALAAAAGPDRGAAAGGGHCPGCGARLSAAGTGAPSAGGLPAEPGAGAVRSALSGPAGLRGVGVVAQDHLPVGRWGGALRSSRGHQPFQKPLPLAFALAI